MGGQSAAASKRLSPSPTAKRDAGIDEPESAHDEQESVSGRCRDTGHDCDENLAEAERVPDPRRELARVRQWPSHRATVAADLRQRRVCVSGTKHERVAP